MGSKNPSHPGGPRRSGAAPHRSVVILAAALLFTSLFVDVGVARAEYPEGWADPDFSELGGCIGVCGSAILLKGPIAKYGFGASCLGCLWNLAVEFNDYINTIREDGDCYTGMLGMPCDGTREWYGS